MTSPDDSKMKSPDNTNFRRKFFDSLPGYRRASKYVWGLLAVFVLASCSADRNAEPSAGNEIVDNTPVPTLVAADDETGENAIPVPAETSTTPFIATPTAEQANNTGVEAVATAIPANVINEINKHLDLPETIADSEIRWLINSGLIPAVDDPRYTPVLASHTGLKAVFPNGEENPYYVYFEFVNADDLEYGDSNYQPTDVIVHNDTVNSDGVTENHFFVITRTDDIPDDAELIMQDAEGNLNNNLTEIGLGTENAGSITWQLNGTVIGEYHFDADTGSYVLTLVENGNQVEMSEAQAALAEYLQDQQQLYSTENPITLEGNEGQSFSFTISAPPTLRYGDQTYSISATLNPSASITENGVSRPINLETDYFLPQLVRMNAHNTISVFDLQDVQNPRKSISLTDLPSDTTIAFHLVKDNTYPTELLPAQPFRYRVTDETNAASTIISVLNGNTLHVFMEIPAAILDDEIPFAELAELGIETAPPEESSLPSQYLLGIIHAGIQALVLDATEGTELTGDRFKPTTTDDDLGIVPGELLLNVLQGGGSFAPQFTNDPLQLLIVKS